jgi:hypothetical protein
MPKHVFLEDTRLIGKLIGANMNVTTDQAITLPDIADFPGGAYIVEYIVVTNASLSLTTAAGGVYTAASKGGSAIVAAGQVYSALTAATKFIKATLAGTALTDRLTGATLYFSLTTGQGAAATADIYVFGRMLQ